MQNKKHRASSILMVGSSALLVCFLIFWLSRDFAYEKEGLKKELYQIFNETVWEIRDSLETDLYYLVIIEDGKRSVKPIPFSGKKDLHLMTKSIDSVIESTFTKEAKALKKDKEIGGSYKYEIAAKYPDSIVVPAEDSMTKGGIIMNVKKADEEYGLAMKMADEMIAKKLGDHGLTLSTELVKVRNRDSFELANAEYLLTKGRKLTGHDQAEVVAVFNNYNKDILRRMIPNILLALFVLSCTVLSLIFIYRSLVKQRQLTLIKNDLISNIAHELKTPITTVGVALEAMSNFNALADGEKTEEYIDISKNEVHRLGILVDKVINTAVFENRELNLKPEVFNIELLIFDIIKSMKIQFEKFSAQVEFDNSIENPSIEGDKVHLTNVIINLIDNAIKYSKDNPHIIIKLARKGKQILLDVVDHGIGIDDGYKEKIFDKFFRVPQGDQHNVKGHGLGLNYVYNVIKQHQGSIEVNSQSGVGTQFMITLPDTYGRS